MARITVEDCLKNINSQYDYPSSDEYWDNDMDEDNFLIQTGAC